MSLRCTSYVAPKPPVQGGLKKRQKGRFRSKSALLSKKVCYKVSLCEDRQLQSCKAFISLPNHAKIFAGGRPLLRENFAETDPPPSKTPICNSYRFSRNI